MILHILRCIFTQTYSRTNISSSIEVGMQQLIVAVSLAVLLLCVRCGGGQMPALGHRSASDTCSIVVAFSD